MWKLSKKCPKPVRGKLQSTPLNPKSRLEWIQRCTLFWHVSYHEGNNINVIQSQYKISSEFFSGTKQVYYKVHLKKQISSSIREKNPKKKEKQCEEYREPACIKQRLPN